MSISFSGVEYAYDKGKRPALNGLSFQIEPGETVALVGPSGAGKSTVASLLLRILEPDQGWILVDGQPLPGIPLEAWRGHLAWVPQNPYLFYGTVAENIGLSCPGAGLDRIIWAAQQAHADTFICRLPQGYDTPLGERGARLSGGEAQRIALARAFLRDAPLVILDEPTANLDPHVESLVEESMARLFEGRTALVIAHRLNTVFRADHILVIDGGQLVEQGSHAELAGRQGLYRQLVGAYLGGGSA